MVVPEIVHLISKLIINIRIGQLVTSNFIQSMNIESDAEFCDWLQILVIIILKFVKTILFL